MKRKFIKHASALLMSGVMLGTFSTAFPASAAPSVRGDVNGDGSFTVADAVTLKDWLLGKGTSLADRKSADLNGDDRVDAFDLVMMRKLLTGNSSAEGDYSGLVISEVCTSNKKSLKDASGASPDWVEIANYSGSAIDLSGVGLSEGAKNRYKFTFPAGTVIPADGFVIVMCDGTDLITDSEFHAPFKLSSAGETVYLTAPADSEGNAGADIDIMEVPELPTDITYGKTGTLLDLLEPTPGAENAVNASVVAKPQFSAEGGFYDSRFDLTLSDAKGNTIIYTLDGSDPRTSSTAKNYSGAIKVYDNTSEPNKLSAKTDISLVKTPAPDYNVDKGIVVRAVCKDSSGKFSDVATNNYYVGKTAPYYTDMKVLSISTDPDNFFDEEKGIYVIGNRYKRWLQSNPPYPDAADSRNPTNYNAQGKEWERPCNIQVFEKGKLKYTDDVGVRISGNWTTARAQKSLTLYARGEYGSSKMHYDFFEGNARDMDGNKIKEYKKVTLRNGGNDNESTRIRDDLNQYLAGELDLSTQAKYDYVVFLDGEFWGYYSMQEKLDKNYVESHYHVDSKNTTIIKLGELDEGSEQSYRDFQTFWSWARSADMSKPENYRRVCEAFDIESFADFVAVQSYIANWDCLWNTNNWMIWRSEVIDESNPYADGKWRFMLYDTEYSAARENTAGVRTDYFSHIDNTWQYASIGSLWHSLMKNSDFRQDFISRFRKVGSETFAPDRAIAAIDGYYDRLADVINATNKRFAQEVDLESGFQVLRYFFTKRYDYAVHHLNKYCGIADDFKEESNMIDQCDWSIWMNDGSGTLKYESDGSITVKVNRTGQYAQLSSHSLDLKAGKTYRMTYTVSASNNIQTYAMFQRAEGDYTSYYYEDRTFTSSPQTFSETVRMDRDDSNVKFLIGLDTGTGTIRISDFRLEVVG